MGQNRLGQESDPPKAGSGGLESDILLMDIIAEVIHEENLNQVHIWERLEPRDRFMFIVCGKYEEKFGAIPKGRIVLYLSTKFPDRFPPDASAEKVWAFLRNDLKWITYNASRGGWYRLSPKGKTVFTQLDEERMKAVDDAFDVLCADIRQMVMPVRKGYWRRPNTHEGHDLLLYYDKGEYERLAEQVNVDRALYAGCLVVCSDEKDPLMVELVNKLKKRIDTEPIVVEHAGWEPKRIPKIVRDFIFANRYKLTFICSAYPRIGLFALVGNLISAMNQNGYFVEFSYARAHEYTYDAGTLAQIKVIPSQRKSYRRLIWFSEINDLRLEETLREVECEELHVVLTSDLVGAMKFNPTIHGLLLGRRGPVLKTHYANFTDADDLFSFLKGLSLSEEDCVLIGGNRLAVLATALLFQQFIDANRAPFGIAWTHVFSTSYSRGFEAVLKNRRFARRIDDDLEPFLNRIGGEPDAIGHIEPGGWN